MKSVRAIFTKQAKDMFKNPMVLVMFIIFPVVALIMTQLVAKSNEDLSNNMFVITPALNSRQSVFYRYGYVGSFSQCGLVLFPTVDFQSNTMMAAIFVGMALVTATAGVIAEDIERKSLHFLVMAGIKPHQYLLGVGGFLLLAGMVTSVIFALIGDFTGIEIAKFLTVMITGAAASITLGASIGMLSKNQQAATSIGMPIAMILGFTPMIASFNETVEKFASVLYTQQLNVIVNDFSENFTKAITVIGVNIAVLFILFVFAYKKKGLKG